LKGKGKEKYKEPQLSFVYVEWNIATSAKGQLEQDTSQPLQTKLRRFLAVTSTLAKSIATTPMTYKIPALEFKDLKAQPTP
jgi:hypothetical protein